MCSLQIANNLIVARRCTIYTTHAPVAAINKAPETCSSAIMLGRIVALQVCESYKGPGAGAVRNVTLVFIVSRDAVADDEADNGWLR
jgi:hypothetical protein